MVKNLLVSLFFLFAVSYSNASEICGVVKSISIENPPVNGFVNSYKVEFNDGRSISSVTVGTDTPFIAASLMNNISICFSPDKNRYVFSSASK